MKIDTLEKTKEQKDEKQSNNAQVVYVKEQGHILKLLPWILTLIMLVAICFLLILNRLQRREQTVLNFRATVEHKLEAIQELASYEYTYSDFAIKENSRSLVGIEMPGTTNTVIIVYDGKIKYGFDLSKCTYETDEETKTISITLPEIEVLDNYINTESVQTYEFNNIFNPISNSDFIEELQSEKEIHLQRAEDEGVLDLAKEHAEEIIANIFSAFDGYEVVFN